MEITTSAAKRTRSSNHYILNRIWNCLWSDHYQRILNFLNSIIIITNNSKKRKFDVNKENKNKRAIHELLNQLPYLIINLLYVHLYMLLFVVAFLLPLMKIFPFWFFIWNETWIWTSSQEMLRAVTYVT